MQEEGTRYKRQPHRQRVGNAFFWQCVNKRSHRDLRIGIFKGETLEALCGIPNDQELEFAKHEGKTSALQNFPFGDNAVFLTGLCCKEPYRSSPRRYQSIISRVTLARDLLITPPPWNSHGDWAIHRQSLPSNPLQLGLASIKRVEMV